MELLTTINFFDGWKASDLQAFNAAVHIGIAVVIVLAVAAWMLGSRQRVR